MKKKAAKVFRKYSDGKIEVVEKYHGTVMKKGETTTAIQTTKQSLFSAISRILTKGSKEEQRLVAKPLEHFKEDHGEETGVYLKY